MNAYPFPICASERRHIVQWKDLSVCLHWGLVLVEMGKRVLCAVVVRIVVCIDGLRFQARNGIKLLDRSRTESGQCSEDCALDFGDLGVFHRIDQSVLGLGSMILEFLCGILLTERRDLVEVHLQIMGHLLSEIILWCPKGPRGNHGEQEHCNGAEHCCEFNTTRAGAPKDVPR